MSVRYLLLAALVPVAVLAQPQGRVVWSFEGNDGVYDAIAIPDVNGDSLPDVVAAMYYGAYPTDPRKLYCCSGATGETVWVSRAAYGTWGNKGLDACPDMNGDGFGDVLLGTVGTYIPPGRSCIAVDGRTGTNLWIYSRQDTWGWVYSVRSFADIDGDSITDVLAGSGTTTNWAGAAVLVSGGTGQAIWLRQMYDDGVGSVAPFADVDGDARPDVLVGVGGNSNSDSVLCLSGATGATIWRSEAAASVSDVERIADVNNSGTDDVIGGGWDYNVYCLEGSSGALIWNSPQGSGRVVMEVVPIRDVNGDGRSDVIIGAWNTRVQVLSGADGTLIWSGELSSDVWSVDTLADVTGDAIPEVIAGSLGNGTGMARVFSGASGDVVWTYTFSERVYDVTGAPDLDGDGRPNVLVGLQDHENDPSHLYCFDGLPGSPVAEPRSAQAVAGPQLTFCPQDCVLLLTAPPGRSYVVSFLDAAGRAVAPARRGITGSARSAIMVAGLDLPGVAFAKLTLDNGRSATAKLVIP